MSLGQNSLKALFALAILGLLALAVLGSGLDARKPAATPGLTRDLATSLLQNQGLPLVLVGLILAVAMVSGVFLAKEEWNK